MAEYRLIDVDAIRHLSSLLGGLAAEMRTSAARLTALDDRHASTLHQIGRRASEAAAFVLAKAAAAEPGPFTVGRKDICRASFTAPGAADVELRTLIRSNRAEVGEEIRRVRAELNRLDRLGVRSGQYVEGLRQDYTTLARLAGMNLVYFQVDGLAPIGTRSGRAGYRAGVWIGPPDAEHVLVMIPGMGTTTAGWLEDAVPAATVLQEMGSDLATSHSRGGVAVIPLLAYRPPQNILEALKGGFWRDGAKETTDALAPLPLDGRHVVGWGHSYGAAVLGATASGAEVFDDLIMVGAAGTGTESLEELGVDAEHLYVATNWNDPIRLVPNDYHGVDPASLPHTPIPTTPTTDLDPWKALVSIPWSLVDGLPDHDYLDDDTAMRAFAAITVGVEDLSG